ncbi:MAG: GIY-YIG nuclease family protein [Bacteroidetes bacterium]|nr:GIY-YIG nuclease family protein [Bacteroidota bacterium]
MKAKYYVYMLKCSDETIYTGYTTNLDNRIKAHNEGKGAKYTRGRSPVKLIWSKGFSSLSKALKEEIRIKNLTRKQKLFLIKV